jgi:hypothetical protein
MPKSCARSFNALLFARQGVNQSGQVVPDGGDRSVELPMFDGVLDECSSARLLIRSRS